MSKAKLSAFQLKQKESNPHAPVRGKQVLKYKAEFKRTPGHLRPTRGFVTQTPRKSKCFSLRIEATGHAHIHIIVEYVRARAGVCVCVCVCQAVERFFGKALNKLANSSRTRGRPFAKVRLLEVVVQKYKIPFGPNSQHDIRWHPTSTKIGESCKPLVGKWWLIKRVVHQERISCFASDDTLKISYKYLHQFATCTWNMHKYRDS